MNSPLNSTPHFYKELSGFHDFSNINKNEYYKKVPDDWSVVITDIRGSTTAIESGRYKDVNTLGAATISVLQKSLSTSDFPFTFGGDGATALIHELDREKAEKALLGLKQLAQSQFNMELRVGIISIREVQKNDQLIEVAKFFINPKKSLAMMRGGGLSWADSKIKSEPEKYCIDDHMVSAQELEGLSCRWQPLKSNRGKVLTLLAHPLGKNPQSIIQELLDGIDKIFEGDVSRACPVQSNNLQYKSLLKCLMDEWNYNTNHFNLNFFKRILSIFFSVWIFKFKFPSPFDRQTYTQSLFSHSDYRKYDDLLRMVVDCTNQEVELLQQLLQKLYESNKISFGVHISDHALMTCLVENTQPGGHIHFIDGGDGGYAMAAKALKQKMLKNKVSAPSPLS